MRWLLGLDLHGLAAGPLRVASALVSAEPGSSLILIHVIEEADRSLLGVAELSKKVPDVAREAVEHLVTDLDAQRVVSEIRVVQEGHPAAVLTSHIESSEADALIIGRLALRATDRFIRLGRVARRLLHSLPTAIVVVPPDMDPAKSGAGPVLLVTEAGEESGGAVGFARRLAQAQGRGLLLIHVAPEPAGWGVGVVPQHVVTEARQSMRSKGEAKLNAWASRYGLSDQPSAVLQGSVTGCVVEEAEKRDACMIVCGSRRLGNMARVFVDSVATEIAAAASCPVAVVPPDYGAK